MNLDHLDLGCQIKRNFQLGLKDPLFPIRSFSFTIKAFGSLPLANYSFFLTIGAFGYFDHLTRPFL